MEYDRLYIRFKGRVLGPLTGQKVVELIQRGQVTKQHELSVDSIEWRKAEDFKGLFGSSSRNAKLEEVQKEAEADTSIVRKANSATEWYAELSGDSHGPVSESSVREWASSGRITGETLLWHTGMEEWAPAGTLRPHWFAASKPAQGLSSLHESTNDEVAASIGDFQDALRSKHWVLFLSITGLVIGTLWTVGAIGSFLIIATRDANGPLKVFNLLFSLFQIATSISWLTAHSLLLRYANQLSVLRYRPDPLDKANAIKALNQFWAFAGVVVFVFLIGFLLIVSLFFILGLSVPWPESE